MINMNTLKEFENGIGKRFKVVDGDGKPFHGLLGEHDTILKVNTITGEVEGDKFIAHFSSCRFIQGVPEHLKSVTN